MTFFHSSRLQYAGLSLTLAFCVLAHAADVLDDGPPIAFKFTTGIYQLSGGGIPGGPSLDLNLRATGSFGNAWIGQYRSPVQAITQTRLGWDDNFKLGPIRLTPSLEVATGGYVGASAYAEAGDSWFAGAGVSRTNLQNFINLNFDPGDAWTLAGGYRWADNKVLTLEAVRDNRLNPDQLNVHLIYKTPTGDGERLSLDLLEKSGLVAGTGIRRFGAQVIYDWPRFFIRLAFDPLVNFTTQDMLRISIGTRF